MSQEILPKQPTAKNPPEQFAGDVWVDPIVSPQDGDQRATLALVQFAPGARTAWHSHARGQFLRVTRGAAHFGTRDGEVITARPGDTVYVSPGEEHFHASAEGTFMEHLAMLESADDPSTTTTWLEHVSDEDLAR
ncbi:Cupin domain protein [Curtobacterium sp. 314Chir4.1]|jgi:quercetin dioxygenase-like cupin family protein|uniref:(R)-mandelonitrile lyase n=1 Tax=Curtobacterium sp. 314Chir4.1 TaxID=1279028 RepID=UPI000BD452E3|nr:cupin domain-containing protein [Curtobacterium sp. 314Chir4.1]SOC86377.1 Cupin domain protein [Curtobacterium sp. 314Chir4.1]